MILAFKSKPLKCFPVHHFTCVCDFTHCKLSVINELMIIQSLDAEFVWDCDPYRLGEFCKANFKQVRAELTQALYRIFNQHCFDGKVRENSSKFQRRCSLLVSEIPLQINEIINEWPFFLAATGRHGSNVEREDGQDCRILHIQDSTVPADSGRRLEAASTLCQSTGLGRQTQRHARPRDVPRHELDRVRVQRRARTGVETLVCNV